MQAFIGLTFAWFTLATAQERLECNAQTGGEHCGSKLRARDHLLLQQGITREFSQLELSRQPSKTGLTDPAATAVTDDMPRPQIGGQTGNSIVPLPRTEDLPLDMLPESAQKDLAIQDTTPLPTTSPPDPKKDKADVRLSAYWDLEDCGPMGNDFHRDWCTVQDEGNMYCQQTVPVNGSICPSEYATLRALLGDANTSRPVRIDACEYGFYAQYSCSEIETSLDWSNPWNNIHRIGRASWVHKKNNPVSPWAFMESAKNFEWMMFAITFPCLLALHVYFFSDLPNKTAFHSSSLLVWFAIAFVYWLILNFRLGSEQGIMWFTGYFLELIFSIENIFVFHIVVKVFGAPRRHSEHAMTAILVFQIVLQLVCHLGLATSLRTMTFLPYVLGLWLIYVGISAGLEGEEEHVEFKELFLFKSFQWMARGRIEETFTEEPVYIVENQEDAKDWKFTLLAPMVLCLLVADFLLEIDVTLTKIEEIPNQYMAFTSSVLATFALPELFFVARDLFHRFGLIKYGICFVLIFFGVQLLFNWLISIPDLLSVAIILAVMLLCVLLSVCLKSGKGDSSEKIPWMDASKSTEGDADTAPAALES